MENKDNSKIIALLFIGVLMGALDISIVGPALPSIEKSLQIGARFSGWIFSIYVLFNLMGISLFARLSDLYGRRNIYILALVIFAAGSLIVSLSHDLKLLLIGRSIQGFGASGIFPIASALVGDLFPVEKRGRILGLIGAVFGLAFMIGPFIAGILLHYLSWNFLFMINLPVCLILIAYSIKLLPTHPNTNTSKIDWGGIAALGLALAGFTFALNSIDVSNWKADFIKFRVTGPFILSLLAALFLINHEKRSESPIIKFGFFRDRQVIIVGIIAIVTGIVQACFVFIPKFVVHNFAVQPSIASFMLTPFVLATAVGSPVFGRMIDEYGAKIIIITGLLLSATGFYVLSVTGNQRIVYYSSGVLIGLGLSVLAGSSLRYIMLNRTEIEDRAISQGMLTIFISIGQLTGTAVIGLLLANVSPRHGFEVVFFSLAVLLVFISAVSLALTNDLPQRAVQTTS